MTKPWEISDGHSRLRRRDLRNAALLLPLLAEKIGGLDFRPIDDHPHWYAVSDGTIWSLRTWRGEPVRQLKPWPASGGYLTVKEGKGAERRCCKVHTLICEAFHGKKPEDAQCVRHLDGNCQNNRPENLSWGTNKENVADARKHGTFIVGTANFQAKLTDEIVAACRILHAQGMPLPLLAAYSGATTATLRAAVEGRKWAHVGRILA